MKAEEVKVQMFLKARQQGVSHVVEQVRGAIERRDMPRIDEHIERLDSKLKDISSRLWAGVDVGRGKSETVIHFSEIARYPSEEFPTYGGISRDHLWYLYGSGMFNAAMGQVETSAVPVCVLTPQEEAAEKPSIDIPRVSVMTAQSSVDELTTGVAYKAARLLGYEVLREKLELQSSLMAVLAELEIEPLFEDAVKAYKKQAVLYRQKELKQAMLARPDFAKLNPHYVRNETVAVWEEIAIDDYEKEIPIHALNMAVSIAERFEDSLCPVRFFIEELHDDPFLVVEYREQRVYLAVWSEPGFEMDLNKQDDV